MELHYALYQSCALIPASPEHHNAILEASQRNNSAAGITGFLHREGDSFIQYLEGPKTGLFTTLARIGRDTRHSDFEIISVGSAKQNMMQDWQMGFVDSDQLSFAEMLDVKNGRIDLKTVDPLDIVTFLSANAHALRDRHIAA